MTPHEIALNAVLEGVAEGLALWDSGGRLGVHNAAFAHVLGLNLTDLSTGMLLHEVMVMAAEAGRASHHGVQVTLRELEAAVRLREAVTWDCETEDNRFLRVKVRPTPNGGWLSAWNDVTEQIREKAKASHLNQYDGLTNLPNRMFFRQRLAEVLARGGNPVVMFVDLDRFKPVNDTLGHAAGDALLRAVARRITSYIDGLTARLGGDEFATALIHGESLAEAAEIARDLIAALSKPFPLGEGEVSIGASVGLALASQSGRDPENLLRAADTALYAAKAGGRGAFRFYEPAMGDAISRRRTLEAKLGGAIERGEIQLHYQPIVSIRDRRVSAVEALMRWRSPEHGWVSPSEFIPVAEMTRHVLPLGAWALHRACCDAVLLPEHVRVAVNLSAAQFLANDIIADVHRALSASGIAPRRLELEVTESMMVDDAPGVRRTLETLRAMGVRIGMDDFGTGYSSLGQLREFPFDKIKIDRSFVLDITSGRRGAAAIVQAVVDVAKALGAETVAEGVETREQAAALAAAGCDHIQGWLFGKPTPIECIVATIPPLPVAPGSQLIRERRLQGGVASNPSQPGS